MSAPEPGVPDAGAAGAGAAGAHRSGRPGAAGDRGALRWYPPAWRQRYGDELLAMVEDTTGGGPTPLRMRVSLAGRGLGERARAAHLVGSSGTPADRRRAGALVVAAAWAATVLGGARFAKLAEHYGTLVHPGNWAMVNGAYDALTVAAAVGLGAAVLAALVALPAAWRWARAGGLRSVRPHLAVASSATVAAAAMAWPLAGWAHHLTAAQRNGTDGGYAAAFSLWAALAAVAVVGWAVAVVAVGRRLALTDRQLRVETALAAVLALAVVACPVAVACWWVGLSSVAPPVAGADTGTLVAIEALMVAAAAAANAGVARIALAR